MFCPKCGSKLSDDSKFCHQCGNNINKPTTSLKLKNTNTNKIGANPTDVKTSNGDSVTVEEYISRTNIKDTEEARKYLTNLKILFWAVFIGMVIIRGGESSNSDIFIFLWLAYLVLLIYFVIYCAKVVKAEKISRAWWPFSFFFAPISWIWFYPEITEPLKIIMGEKPLPKSFQPESTPEEIKKKEEDYKKWQKRNLIIFGIVVGSIVLICIIFGIIASYSR